MSTVFKRGPAVVEANLTPMIDMTFLLIVFFVLASRIVDVETVPMSLPEPDDPVTQPPGEEGRAVINLIPAAGGRASGYLLGGTMFPEGEEGLLGLRGALGALYAANPLLHVNLRADRSTQYEFVEPVLQAVSDAASSVEGVAVTPRVNLVVVRSE